MLLTILHTILYTLCTLADAYRFDQIQSVLPALQGSPNQLQGSIQVTYR